MQKSVKREPKKAIPDGPKEKFAQKFYKNRWGEPAFYFGASRD